MATFYNQATLTYNNISTTSNVITGELLDVLSVTKTALVDEYSAGGKTTYAVSIVNSGAAPFSGVSITDDLGEYTFGQTVLTPMTFVDGSVQYYINGLLQAAPAAAAGPQLVISGITVPANGNALLLYEAFTNEFAPLDVGDAITNTVTVSGGGLSNPITASETVTAGNDPTLTISKSVNPSTVTENGRLTYTFVIENTGNTAAVDTDNVMVTDTFNPALDPISVTFNGTVWTAPAQYTYDPATGEFATVTGLITVPAATYTQNTDTGEWTVTPGVSVLTVAGTV